MTQIATEIYYLFLITAFCGLLWIPYVFERFYRIGIKETCGYNDKSINIAPWAIRAQSAHKNLIEKGLAVTTILTGEDIHGDECKKIGGQDLIITNYLNQIFPFIGPIPHDFLF